MQNCKKIKSQFVEALYNDLNKNELERFHTHLEECPNCRKEYIQMQNTIEQMNKDKLPDPGNQFWNEFWDKLDQRMTDEKIEMKKEPLLTNIFTLHPDFRVWTVRILSAAAMLLAGIGIGYLVFNNPDSSVGTITQKTPVRTTAYPQEAADYIESSKILLLGFVNFDTDKIDPTTMDFSRQQQIAKSLVQKAVVLKDDLKGRENQRVLQLVQQLEIIMLQISNCGKEFDIPAIDLIKSGVDNNAILMKINLEEIMRAVSEEKEQSTGEGTSTKKKRQEL